ncbi:helix-turn-helix transcriptional regulator [Sporosarcina sp. Marseille-Q4063]|uniref:helix-turn-helix domain-containing protein n=1 Tax=Sporosarcina sp. Marseille-Q4063 TaxID=2810514 RepID=UPI001BAFD255|nr:helix-turn-helix transcriptional regulator [Sporosarcina sp. Marseille-Q4063]QUW20882.1 helix-turn-helix transcriptional regulator [Sporosarcina sp. Marseille-Q4063]
MTSSVNKKIRCIRKKLNVNQSLIADKLNITVQSYSMKERGTRPITTGELETIAKQLKVPVAIFFEK